MNPEDCFILDILWEKRNKAPVLLDLHRDPVVWSVTRGTARCCEVAGRKSTEGRVCTLLQVRVGSPKLLNQLVFRIMSSQGVKHDGSVYYPCTSYHSINHFNRQFSLAVG